MPKTPDIHVQCGLEIRVRQNANRSMQSHATVIDEDIKVTAKLGDGSARALFCGCYVCEVCLYRNRPPPGLFDLINDRTRRSFAV